MKSAIVTGATSSIGVHLIKELITNNIKVYAIVRPNSKNLYRLSDFEKNPNLKVIPLDMNEIEKISSCINHKVDCFYHLAWEGARAPHRDNNQLQKDNFLQALKAFQAAKELEVKTFIGSGSQAEYGSTKGSVDENHICKPVTEYGIYKYKACQELSKLAEENKMQFIWCRIFSVFGRYDYSGTLVMSCIDRMKKDEPINMTKGIQQWDYVYIEDLAKAFARFGEQKCESGVYNLASGVSRPLYEFVEDIKRALNSKSKLNFGVIPYGTEGPVNLQPSVAKVEKAIGWKAETSFQEGIKQLLILENI
jgi:UDP-glucose 4-epimerase